MDESLNKFLDAVNGGNTALVTELISKGANIEVRDDQGQTPLLIASSGYSYNYLDVVRVLIQAKCDLKAKDHSGQNALHKAILGRSYGENIADILLDTRKVEYDLKDNQGKSPIDYAKEKWSGSKDPGDTMEKILDIKCQNLLKRGDFETLFSDQDLVIYLIKTKPSEALNLINYGIGMNVNAPGVCYIKSPLYYSFREGHSALFRKLIDLGADIGTLEIDYNLPLNYNYPSLKAGFDILSILVQQGFNLNAQDEQGRSALYLALEYSQKETAAALIRLGCDVNLPDKDGRYPLHKVMQATLDPNDRMFIIDMLLSNGADLRVRDKEDKNPLHKAMEVYHSLPEEKVNILYRFLANGVDINDIDRYGQTPFRKALDVYLKAEKNFQHENDLYVLDMLLANRANINVPDSAGQTSIDVIICNPDNQRSNGLLQHTLLQAKVNNPNHLGQNLLHIAAQCADAKTLVNLSEKYPDAAFSQDNDGKTPLHLAVEKGYYEASSVLLERFSHLIHITDNDGCTPLHYGACRGKNMVELLIKHGADINALDKYKNSPADTGAWHANRGRLMDGLEALLDKGEAFAIKPQFSELPKNNLLHKAIRSGATLTAIHLIKNGFDIYQEDHNGLTPLSLAIENNQNKIAFALLDKDRLITPSLISGGRVPLDYAIGKKNIKLITKLMDLGVSVTFEQFDSLVKTISKSDHLDFFHLMIKCLDPETNVVAKDHRVYQEALKQVFENVDKFKAQAKEYPKLEEMRGIVKSLKNIKKDPNYFDYFDKQGELLKLCQELLPSVEKEYSALSESHFEHLLSSSDSSSLKRYELKKTPDEHIKKVVALYLKDEGHKLIEVSKAGILTLDPIIQPIKGLDSVPKVEVKETGASDEGEF